MQARCIGAADKEDVPERPEVADGGIADDIVAVIKDERAIQATSVGDQHGRRQRQDGEPGRTGRRPHPDGGADVLARRFLVDLPWHRAVIQTQADWGTKQIPLAERDQCVAYR